MLSAALTELAVLVKTQPSLVKEKNHSFTECATFADDIKGKGYSFQSDWHFTNEPYLDEPGTTIDDFNFTIPDIDVIGAMVDLTKFLKNEMTVSESTYLKAIADKLSDDADQRSFAVRLLIHFVGDIHQPEHAVALVDSKYPTGDRGGNSEKIPSKSGVGNLHFVWDSVLYEYTGRPNLPLSDSDFDWYTTEAAKLAGEYSVSSSDLKAQDFNGWAKESLEMAETFVYPNFVSGEDPDQAYIDAAKPVCEKSLIVAGARLAALMVNIYGDNGV